MANVNSMVGLGAGTLRALDRRSRRRIFRNSFWSILCIALSFLTLVPLFSIVFLVLQKGLPLLNLQSFTQLPPAPGLTGGGFGNAIQGTVVMVLIALLLSSPLGALSAIYVCEYGPRTRLSHIV